MSIERENLKSFDELCDLAKQSLKLYQEHQLNEHDIQRVCELICNFLVPRAENIELDG